MHKNSIERAKQKVMHQADVHKEELQEEFEQLKTKAEHALTTALIIGGALTLGYIISQKFFSGTSKKKKVKFRRKDKQTAQEDDYEAEDKSTSNEFIGRIGESLLNQATAILLDIAKEKLIDFLQSQQSKSNEGHAPRADQ